MKLEKLRINLHRKILLLKQIETIVNGPRFEAFWKLSDLIERETAKNLINACDKDGLINWMKRHPSLDLGDMSSNTLKSIAREFRVKNYSRMTIAELIPAIEAEYEKRRIY